jgi:hypothetical protein
MARIRFTITEEDLEGGRSSNAVPAGTYSAVIDNAETRNSQNSGQPMIVMTYKILTGKFKGETPMEFLSLSDKARWRLIGRMKDFGIRLKKGDFSLDLDEIIGLPIDLQLGKPRTDPNGIERSNVVGLIVKEDGEAEEPDVEESDGEAGSSVVKKKKAKAKTDDDEEEKEEDEEEEEETERRPLRRLRR